MPYFANDTHAKKISRYIRAGIIDLERLATLIGITTKQLEDNYSFELGYTDDEDLAVVADVAFEMASDGKHPDITKWWLRVKGGWRESEETLVTEAAPLTVFMAPREEGEKKPLH